MLSNHYDTITRMSKDTEDVEIKRKHSASHIMTAAMQMIYGKDIGLGVGPWTDEGFYQDYDLNDAEISDKDFKKIEKKMRWIVNKDMPIKKEAVDKKKALELSEGDPYKTELVEEIAEKGEDISFYYIGESLDSAISVNLCAGPHLESTGGLGVFKLERLAGAYWRGNEKNKMLTRIYGVAFESQEQLDKHLEMLEEAKKRDHRKLGKELDLFTFSPLVGTGLPLWTPRGTMMRNLIVEKIQNIQRAYGYQDVTIPHITKKDLYETSGHWEKFGDELFKVTGQSDTEFVMKPMNCPHHTQIYAARPRSYKELPVRFAETTMVYRDEQAGELLGLSRVRSITQDDAHVFCTKEQIEQEIGIIVSVIKEFYTSLNMFNKGDFWVSVSVRGKETPEKYLGDTKNWDLAEDILEEIVKKENFDYKVVEGEAAFYGPKIDFMFKDAIGRQWQLATAQLDFVMPERFALEYTNEKGEKEMPVMIHRAVAGSLERFLSVMIEHFAGAFPLWLSPEQVRVLPIGDSHKEYSKEVFEELKRAGVRVELDDSDDTLGKRIRNVKIAKVPYFLVIGDDEVKNKTVTVESRDNGKVGTQKPDEFAGLLLKEIEGKS